MLPGFEPADPTIKRPQTLALYRAATGIGPVDVYNKRAGLLDSICNITKHSTERFTFPTLVALLQFTFIPT